ncbi:MAG: polysaccharide pyruvyl transferase family protein [Candidatus Thorarchaeota archaeon]|jgi:hypothetical protein
MSRRLALVSGAKKNVGDFLIFRKSQELIQHHLKPKEIVVVKRSEPFDSLLQDVNQTAGMIICGGPGYRRHFNRTYSFFEHYDSLEIPIIPLGLGWQGVPLYHPEKFSFNKQSISLIRQIHKSIPLSTTRDEITRNILLNTGITNVVNSGCPTLFDFEKMRLNTQFTKPTDPKQIAVSMAQNPTLYRQNLDLLEDIKKRFPDVEIHTVFHRGVDTDVFTSEEEGHQLRRFVRKTKEMGFEIIDLAYNLDRISVYQDADFHVGYRVHAHAYCISQRIPSFLLWEDGRGQGMSLNLGTGGFPARKPRPIVRLPLRGKIRDHLLYGRSRIPVIGSPHVDDAAVTRIMKLVDEQISSEFTVFDSIPERIDFLYSHMKEFFRKTENFLFR